MTYTTESVWLPAGFVVRGTVIRDERTGVTDRRANPQVSLFSGRRIYDVRTGMPRGQDGDTLYGRRGSDPR